MRFKGSVLVRLTQLLSFLLSVTWLNTLTWSPQGDSARSHMQPLTNDADMHRFELREENPTGAGNMQTSHSKSQLTSRREPALKTAPTDQALSFSVKFNTESC